MITRNLAVALVLNGLVSGVAAQPPSAVEEGSPETTAPETTAPEAQDRDELLSLYGMLAEAVAQVELHYARPVDRCRLIEAAIDGMLKELDPYSAYLPPKKLETYEERFADNGKSKSQPTVFGLQRGAAGEWRFLVREEPKIACIGVASFAKATPLELRSAVEQSIDQGARAIILDLRFNAGGLLTSAVDCADLFLASGLIVSTEGRNAKRREWRAAGDTATAVPLVALVNGQSASGAEVLAAALEDNKRATVVGARTWGKGSVQNVFEIDDGRRAIKLTTAAYHRPSGVNIHRFPGMTAGDTWGVTPAPEWTLVVDQKESRTISQRREALFAADDTPTDKPPVVDRQLDLAVKAAVTLLEEPSP